MTAETLSDLKREWAVTPRVRFGLTVGTSLEVDLVGFKCINIMADDIILRKCDRLTQEKPL